MDFVLLVKNKEIFDLEVKKFVMNFYLKEICNVFLVKIFR